MTALLGRERPRAPAPRRRPPRRLAALASPTLAGAVLAAVLAGVVLALPRFGTDISAQSAWAAFAAAHPTSAVDFSWFGGVYPAAYSVATPYLMAVLGVMLTGTLAAVGATAALTSTFAAWRTRWVGAVGVWVAFAAATALFAGQITFLVGLAFGAAAVRLLLVPGGWSRRRVAGAALLAALTTLASPVAGLFLGVVSAVVVLCGPDRRSGWVLGLPTAAALGAVRLAYPQWGTQPTSWDTVAPAIIGGLLVAALVGRRHRTVAVACLLYAAGSLAAWLTPNPVGSNVARLALAVGTPLLITLGRRRAAVALISGLLAVWMLYQPVGDIEFGVDHAATQASYYQPLLAQLAARDAWASRVEVVPLADHWESYYLGGTVLLARGWERQLDSSRNALFYHGRLNAASYQRWLSAQAVGYVALADGPLDWAAPGEARLLRRGLPYLHEVWRGAHWTLWRVVGATPLASGGRVTAVSSAAVSVRARAAGTVTLRVRYSSWLSVHGPAGACLAPAGRWTDMRVATAGTYRVSSSWLHGGGPACPPVRP